MQGSNNKEWLIKSSGEIKGPYTFEEIVQGIVSKEFILVDEISRKFNRWKYLRDEEAFERAILEHKNKEYSKNEKTFTNSGTDTLTEEIKNNVVSFNVKEGLLSNVQEHLKENEQARNTTQQKVETPRIENVQVKNYAAEADLKKQAADSGSFTKVLITLIIIIAAGFYFYSGKKEKSLSYDDLRKIAYDNVNGGNFPDAKTYLEKALAVNGTNEELKYLLAYVSVDTDDTVTAQRLLGELKSVQDQKIKSHSLNLLGVLQLKNFNLDDAKKNFDAALVENPKFPAAHFNKGVALYLENKFDQAHESLTQSLVNGGIDGTILLAMSELAARQASDFKTNNSLRKQVGDILNLLTRQSSGSYAYRQEFKVASAYLYHLLGEKDYMIKAIEETVNVDPTLTTDHVSDVLYYSGLVTWDRLSDWIKKMRDANGTNANLKTLYGYALFKGSEKMKGKDVIEGLLKSDYSNTSNQIIHSYILMSLKRDDDAKAALAPIMHHRDKSLSFTLMGKICLIKKDLPCADLNFSEALRIDKSSISAMAGLADVYLEQKDYKKAQDLVKQVYKLSPSYKPILAVKQKLDAATKTK